jgi:hypothetical protein
MPLLRWRAKHGEAPVVTLACARTVELSPANGSVGSNTVYIKGEGTIESLGNGPSGEIDPQGREWGLAITKTVFFDAGITLKHSLQLTTLSLRDRVMLTPSVGIYRCNGGRIWGEVFFAATGAADVSRRLDDIEMRLARIEKSIPPDR